MKLAVIMAVHNNQKTLQGAVSSILNQTLKNFRFFIIDDASTDDSSTIIAKYTLEDKRVKVITNQNHLGLTKSLNKALKEIKSQYIARMDADDLALPTRFEKQLDYLEKHPEISLVGTAAYLIDDQEKQLGLKRYPNDHQTLRRLVLHYCPFIHPTWMFRRSVLGQIGDYHQDFPFAQDYDFILRLLAAHQVANLPQPLLKYRVDSPQAISLKNLKQQEKLALKARFRALTHYHYPLNEAWKLIKPCLSYLVPVSIKKIIYKKFYWQTV